MRSRVLTATMMTLITATTLAAEEESGYKVPGLPSAVDWTFNLDATWGFFGFKDSLYTNPKPDDASGDLSDKGFCDRIVAETVKEFGRLDILVNNAAEQFPAESVEELNFENLESTFRVNCFSMFYLTQAALPHLKKGSSIINTASVTAYRGSPQLLDYSATKGAIVAFTRSLSKQLIKKGIYVNAVAPGPVWTPLIAATFPPDKVAEFGTDVPIGRAAQPSEIAPCYVFLASDDSSYMSGQVLHPNGGEIING